MRLLNVDTLQLETFESELPQYAILSHRWVRYELKFSDVMGHNWADETKTPGARKVIDACGQAKKDGFQYMWVDTCCIDKTSSAELSESINSMFNWYRWSEICYAFLSDVEKEQDFSRSQWFGRGWTLQELIAPRILRFFDASWNSIGDRTERATETAEITGIDKAILRHRHSRENIRNSLDFYSVAARLSWFGTRETTRVEDRAYCLMGLFDVNMPLLYGEGEKAVPRLVGEIIQRTADPSILMQLNTSYAFGGGIGDPNEIRRLHLYGTDSSRLFNS